MSHYISLNPRSLYMYCNETHEMYQQNYYMGSFFPIFKRMKWYDYRDVRKMSDMLTKLTNWGLFLPHQVVKRNGSYVAFDISRITRAVTNCYNALDKQPSTPVTDIVASVANTVASQYPEGTTPTVEQVQDIVEVTLLAAGEFLAARNYIVYRENHAKQRVVIPIEVQEAFDKDKIHFPTQLQQFMFYDKYSRYNWELGRRETWLETVDRVVIYLCKLSENKLSAQVYERIHAAILNMKVMPSMRLLAMAGPAAERNSASIYNCSYLPVRDILAFPEAMLISMAGCGVGYSVERENVEQFPRITRQTNEHVPIYKIDDSTEGWAAALTIGLEAWFNGRDVEYDYSLLRPAGAPLLVKGGRASGHEPLKVVLDFCRAKLLSRQGTFLRTIDAHDMMCVTGGAAVSGGVRRTAMIAIFDYDDTEMRTCKDGTKLNDNPHRWNANNSAVWPQEIDQIDLIDQMTEMYRNQRGEPGIFSRTNANSSKPERRAEGIFGPNPCVTGDTVIATFDGPRTFASLAEIGEDVLVYAWHPATKKPVIRWMRRPHLTRRNVEVFEVEFDSGLVVRCTPDHNFYSFRGKKIQAQNLEIGTSIRAWSMSEHRDGHLRVHGWDSDTNLAAHQYVARMVYECFYGTIPKGMIVHHKNEDKLDNWHTNLGLITPVEHNQEHYPARFAAGFDGTSPNHKVVGIYKAGIEDVYNGMVDDAHTYIILDSEPIAGIMSGIVSANCGEIDLRPYEFCNLSIAVARPEDTYETLSDKVHIATIIGTIQSLAITFPGLREEWGNNCKEERLLGVDISGQQDCPAVQSDEVLSRLSNEAVVVNHAYASLLGINPSAAVTCNKPNGNSSLLLNCSSGIHVRWAPFYIRNVRVSAYTPLYRVLKNAGVPMDPENGQTPQNASTWVAHFPVKSPEGAKTRIGYSAIDQCEYWLLNKLHWTEHNPSVTITYTPDELLDVIKWVWEHRYVIGGMAFLPASDAKYAQMPYEEIDEETYEELVSTFPEINFALLYGYEQSDMTESASTVACMSGQCEI